MRSLTRWRSSWAEVLSASGALALGAGMLAALNPCGFALLPAYLTLLVTGDQPSRAVAVTRALMMTAAMTAGFTAVFAVFGLVVAPVASSAQRYLPWFSLAVGLALAGVGLWLLAGRSIAVPRSRPRGQAPITRSWGSMFGFGVSYALASLTCTIAPFLSVVVSAFRADSLLPVLAFSSSTPPEWASWSGRRRSPSRWPSSHWSAALAAWAGSSPPRAVCCCCSWAPTSPTTAGGRFASLGGAPTEDKMIEAAAAVQHWLANTATSIGAWGFALVLVGSVVAVSLPRVGHRLLMRSRTRSDAAHDS